MSKIFDIITEEVNKFLNEENYQMWHKAPGPDDAPMHDMTVLFPDDFYGPNAVKIYRNIGNPQAIYLIQSAKNQPDKPIKIYRAVPQTDDGLEINNGDWVTINPDYAKRHAESNIDGPYEIVSKTVPAQNLYNEGNSLFEWGYYVN